MANRNSGPVNLASVPREEAIKRARIAGREILGNAEAIQAIADTLWMNWININAPVAVGQTDDQFGALVDDLSTEFFDGMSEGVVRFRSIDVETNDNRTLERINDFLARDSRELWGIHNVLAFMVAALPDDTVDELPTRCTLIDLCKSTNSLATSLMDLVSKARHG